MVALSICLLPVLRNFACVLSSPDFFSKSFVSKKSCREHYQSVNQLNPDHCSNCLQMLSADDTRSNELTSLPATDNFLNTGLTFTV